MAMLGGDDKAQLRANAADMGSELAVRMVNKAFYASTMPA